MKIFLASTGRHPLMIEAISKMVGGFNGKKVVFIPTASNGEIDYGLWKTQSETLPVLQGLGVDLTTLQLEDYKNDSDEVLRILKSSDIIWMGGGMPGYLLYWLRRTKIDQNIKDVLNSDILYVGSSAGSMVTSRYSDLAEWYLGEEEPGASVIPGLDLVDFEFYPHFLEEDFEKIKNIFTERYKGQGRKMYLAEDGEAVIVNGNKLEFIGNPILLEA